MTVTITDNERAEETRCGFVAVVGAPNVGKSTLVNNLVGAKISITSPKVQTTRNRVMGITLVSELNAQVIFIDTPGIFMPGRRLERAMVRSAWNGIEEADCLLLVVDVVKGLDDDTKRITEKFIKEQRRAILALNKIDMIKRDRLLPMAGKFADMGIFDQTFMISARNGDGTDDLLQYFARNVPFSHWHFPEDYLSDMPMRLLAAEITREQIYHKLHDELPYDMMVKTEAWQENDDGSVRIDQVIYVQRASQKAIFLGKAGHQIKETGSRARLELIEILGCPVHLFLHVKVQADWSEERKNYSDIGLDFDV